MNAVDAASAGGTGRDQAALVGVDHCLDAVAEAELLQDVGDVRLRRRLADDELLADLGVRLSSGGASFSMKPLAPARRQS